MTTSPQRECQVSSGQCPDAQCGAKLFFPAASQASIECSGCGQRHLPAALRNVEPVTDPQVALHNILKNVLLSGRRPKRDTDSVQVNGVSNFQCKLLSPLLTTHGMERQTGVARPLRDLGQPPTFDCAALASRAFSLDVAHVDVAGYGRDRTGGAAYLRETLAAVGGGGVGGEVGGLVPIHADGDGHCLVHALSRALVGRELFWHALRENLATHFSDNIDTYRYLLHDFIGHDEWDDIIAECAPDYAPADGGMLGMRNVHIFGLANVLHRPIILLDSISGIRSLADYTGVFLPSLVAVDDCRGEDGDLHRPLCIAWSSSARNHYIALVSIRKRPLPSLPAWMIPKVWGVPQQLLSHYVKLEADGRCLIGGYKYLQDGYILRLVSAMETLFKEQNGVSTALVNDVYQCIYKSTGMAGLVKPDTVVEQTRRAVTDGRLYRCLLCDAVSERTLAPASLRRGGALYNLAVSSHGTLSAAKAYSFPTHGIVCRYNAETDQLVVKESTNQPSQCCWCQGSQMRLVRRDGGVEYEDGDRTATRTATSRCQCGFKHFYNGVEYDNLPEILPVSLDWAGRHVTEQVAWFQHEADTTLNSNVFKVAQTLVQKHFPGEFGSERLVQSVVDTILRQTAQKEGGSEEGTVTTDTRTSSPSTHHEQTDSSWRQDVASKIILTGALSKSLHKEQLGCNATERAVAARLQQQAPLNQAKVQQNQAKVQQSQAKAQQTAVPRRRAGAQLAPAQTPPKVSIKQAKTTDAETRSAPATPAEGATRPTTGSDAAETEKKIRVSTSDGRQLMLSLHPAFTYRHLQARLSEELSIPPDRQRIKHGFPPRPLLPPGGDGANHDEPLAVRNGDRITVEVIADRTEERQPVMRGVVDAWPAKPQTRNSWSGFESNSRDHSAHELLNGLTRLQNTSADSLDMAIGSLGLMATLTGRDMWTHVQGMPHLFSIGGLFYQQAQRDLGLADGKHCTLPALPGKVFRYNALEYRLELCLEPHGHFPVAPGVESRVLNAAILPRPPGGAATHAAPPGGAGVHRDIRMPRDLTPHGATHAGHAPPHPSSIREDDDGDASAGVRTRLGPGYSVMTAAAPPGGGDGERAAAAATRTEVSAELRQLASQIEAIVARTALEGITEEPKTIDDDVSCDSSGLSPTGGATGQCQLARCQTNEEMTPPTTQPTTSPTTQTTMQTMTHTTTQPTTQTTTQTTTDSQRDSSELTDDANSMETT